LTEYNIEGRLGKGSSKALASHHSMAMPSAVAVERATVIIGALASNPNNARGVAELARCNASDNTSSASDIQNAIPLTQSSGLYQLVRPGSENDRDQVTLVVFRHTCKEVPATRTSCEPSSPMRIFKDIAVRAAVKTLRYPSPEEFIFRHITGSPLGSAVGQAGESARTATLAEIQTRLASAVDEGGLAFSIEANIVVART